ncbi:hypothetical protein [Pseudescherichia sp.]|uniref:hypothetical protein n=1 Tax=Pseudescherichia sp. TaxID=2055881 RepID=UPI002896DEBA|nr:hypothetical protein [Pseudescherichia sp.]
MSDIILYTQPGYQGDSITVSPAQFLDVYTQPGWQYRSARLNGNKLMIRATFASFDPVNTEETFTHEDVSDLTTLIQTRDDLLTAWVLCLTSNDIIISMDIHHTLRGFRTVAVSSLLYTGKYVFGECYENYTTDPIPATLAILNPETQPALIVDLKATASSQYIVSDDKMEYTGGTLVNLLYDPESDTVDVKLTDPQFTVSIEKIDDTRRLAHFTFTSDLYNHCFLHTKEDYGDNNATLAFEQLSQVRSEEGTWQYKSLEIVSVSQYKMAWLWTEYPDDGTGYDFNQYRSYATSSSLQTLPAIFDDTDSSLVSIAYNYDILPVFLRPVNADAPDNWQGFIIESQFSSSQLIHSSATPLFKSFCTNNPDLVQPGMLAIINEDNDRMAYNSCSLRYGSLGADGSTVTWHGVTSINIDYAGADSLMLSLPAGAPESWAITSVTRGALGWYVEITGSVM